MIYECDKCSAALPPGVMSCPKCGDPFDEAVPSDAQVPSKGFTARPTQSPPAVSPDTSIGYEGQAIGPHPTYPWLDVPPDSRATASTAIAAKKRNPLLGCLGILVLLGAIWAFGTIFTDSDGKTGAPASSSASDSSGRQSDNELQAVDRQVTDLGGEGVLQGAPLAAGGKNDIVVLAPTKDDYDAFVKSNVASDSDGLHDLATSGRIYSVPAGQVRAKKLDSNWTGMIQVRILSGDHSGEAAWTSMECLQKP